MDLGLVEKSSLNLFVDDGSALSTHLFYAFLLIGLRLYLDLLPLQCSLCWSGAKACGCGCSEAICVSYGLLKIVFLLERILLGCCFFGDETEIDKKLLCVGKGAADTLVELRNKESGKLITKERHTMLHLANCDLAWILYSCMLCSHCN